MRWACTPFRGCRLYRPRGTLFQPMLEFVGLACTPFRERRLYRPRGTVIQFYILLLLERVGSVSPPAGVGDTDRSGRFFSRRWSAWGVYPIPRTSSVPTSRDDLSVSQPAVACVRGACTPFQSKKDKKMT